MGNKKPPKKPPPNTKSMKQLKTINQTIDPPIKALNSVEKDIGTQDSISESTNAQSTRPPTVLAITNVEGPSKNTEAPLRGEAITAKADEKDNHVVIIHNQSSAVIHERTACTENKENTMVSTAPKDSNTWADLVRGPPNPLQKRGNAFTLESGEAYVRISNSVIDTHKKAWDCFVLGQFYSAPPSQGTIHNIVNGIWSKHYRDIVVSKMEGQAFLFRIPNATTRHRVLLQRLRKIEGRTMFVAKWEPGVTQAKPELTSAPIWLELRDVPLQFFNDEGLEHIAGMVGEPKFLHPATENKTNLEVAKVFTLIDPRKPLPEAVNVQYDSGEIK